MSNRTRNALFIKMSNLVGNGKELYVSELPTARNILRYGILLREISEKNSRNYTVDQLVTDMLPNVLGQWLKANALFVYPVVIHEKTIFKKLKYLWKSAVDFSNGRGKKAEKERFSLKLDKLVDILLCKCKLILCSEYKCDSGCMEKIHIKCKCKREEKIPIVELQFIYSQRTKIGSFGTFHIGSADRKESKKIEKKQQQKIAVIKKKKADETNDELEQFDCLNENESVSLFQTHIGEDYIRHETVMQENVYANSSSTAFQDNSEQNIIQVDIQTKCKSPLNQTFSMYNTMKIKNIALASMRHQTSLREAAEIATATLIDAKLISESDLHLIIDHNKIKRAQEKLAKELDNQFEIDLENKPVTCLFFDGRVDATKMFIEVNERNFPSLIKEEHYSVVKDPGGDYLFHFVPDVTANKKKAEVIADYLVDWLKTKNQIQNLMAIGGDSTNVNTGWAGGVMQWVEKKLNRRLVWIVCDLHTGELGLRHLIENLDGKTLSYNKWSGSLGKMLDTATEIEINSNFTKINLGPPLIYLSQEIIKDLSTDQSYAYQICQAIKTGVLPNRLAMLEIGPVCHSRWLTTSLRFCRIWVSNHGLTGENLENLRMIVNFIVSVYIPNWFNIKVKSNWIEGPRHVLYQLELLRTQSKNVLDIVMPTIRRSAWYAHSEAILQAMLCSKNTEERKEAITRILKIRGEGDEVTQVGDSSIRVRKTPEINPHADQLANLITWNLDVTEPPLTCNLTSATIKEFLNYPMEVPPWTSHTQSVERCVKLVTEAAGHVYTHERRESYIRAQLASRHLMSRNRSKKDMANLVQMQVE